MAKSRLVIVASFVASLAFASSLTFLWNTEQSLPDSISFGFVSNLPRAEMATAMADFRQSGGSLQDVDLALADNAAKTDPFADEVYTLNAAGFIASGNRAKARSLLEQAIRRDPRSLEARALLMQVSLDEGEISDAVKHIEVLWRFGPQRAALLGILTSLATVPETRSDTLLALSDDRIRAAVLVNLARRGASASMLLNANAELRWDARPNAQSFVSDLVTPLVKSEDFTGARRLWLSFFSDSISQSDLIADTRFSGSFPAPFGWAANGGQQGFARLGKNGLVGQFYGRRSAVMARQLLVWDPGEYSIMIDGKFGQEGLQVEVACSSGAYRKAASLRTGSRFVLNVVIPRHDCEAQYLSIAGVSNDPPSSVEFEIQQVKVERSMP